MPRPSSLKARVMKKSMTAMSAIPSAVIFAIVLYSSQLGFCETINMRLLVAMKLEIFSLMVILLVCPDAYISISPCISAHNCF